MVTKTEIMIVTTLVGIFIVSEYFDFVRGPRPKEDCENLFKYIIEYVETEEYSYCRELLFPRRNLTSSEEKAIRQRLQKTLQEKKQQ